MSACGSCGRRKTIVTDSDHLACGWTKRRRRCECGHRWSTYELADWELDLTERDPADLRIVPRNEPPIIEEAA